MEDPQLSPHRLNELLARTTRAAFAASTVKGPDVFGRLAEQLADILGVSAALISTLIVERPGWMSARAAWLDGRLLQPFEYDLAQTPCRSVIGQQSRFVAHGVHREFAPGTLFHTKGFDSYAARSLLDSSGRQLGLIVAMDRAPMHDAAVTEAVLQIFAVRASAELERERGQAALAASEASYRAIFEANEDAIFVHDWATGAILDVSPKASELYGYPREALQRLRVGDISANVPPFTERDAMARIEDAKRSADPVRFEWHARHRAGHLMWNEVTLKRAEIAGEPRVLAFVRDITESKQAEKRLRDSEERYRLLFETESDAIVLVDVATLRLIDANRAAQTLWGYERDALLALTVADLSAEPDESRASIQSPTGQIHIPLRMHRRRDGSVFPVEITANRLILEGRPTVVAAVRDITERKRAEEAVHASEEQYRSIFNASVDAMVLWDSDLRRVDINPAYERLFGLTREQVLAGIGFEHLPIEYTEYRRQLVRRTLAGERCHAELRSIRRTGQPLDVEVHTIPIQHRGQPHVLAIVRDITERKKAEDALRASEEQYRAIFNASVDGLLLWDADHHIVDVNEAFLSLHGYQRDDLIGLAEPVFIPNDLQSQCSTLLPQIIAGEPCHIEATSRRKDGGQFDVEIHGVPIQYQGRPHALIVLRDISQRKEQEEDLRRSEGRLRATVEAALDAVIGMDAAGNIVEFNAAAERCFGHRRADVLGKSLATMVIPQRHRHRHNAGMEHYLRTGEGPYLGRRVEVEALRADGTEFPAELAIGVAQSREGPIFIGYLRDITERRRAEERLRASEEQYRVIFDGSADALALWNSNIRMVDVNTAMTEMYGYAREEVVGKSYSDRMPREAVEKRIELIRGALAGQTGQLETVGIRKNGERFDVELRFLPIDFRGEPHVLVIGRDITERKRAEDALRASEEQYRAIFNATDDSLVLRDAQFRIVDVNAAFEAMSGRRREETVGISELTLTRDATAIDRRALHAEALAGKTVHFEAKGRRDDGQPFVLEVRGIPMIYGGEPHVLYIGRDATEHKRAEAALRASEEQYRAIFNASADALVLRDADFRIVDVNATYEAMTGRSREEVLGADRVLANPPEVNQTIKPLHEKALSGESIVLETQLVRRDGARYELELRGVPIQHRGAPHVLYMGRDITARRRAEDQQRELQAQLRQVQKMEAIGQLTGGIAHDFNNILAAIMGYVGLALERPGTAADRKLGEYLEQAEQGCRRARDLIQQMLAFSRGRHGERRALSLPALIDESLRLLRATFPSSIALGVEPAGDTAVVEVDPVQLQQVLLNLGINARDAIGSTGHIRFGVRQETFTGHVCASCGQPFSGAFHRLWVADSGPGISPQLLGRIFEPFFSTKAPGRGTGMGLATVHRIVHDHDGHLLVESDQGARFSVLLPADRAAAAAQPVDVTAAPAPRRVLLRGRVLLVDDEESVLGFMRELLQSWGLDVVAVRQAPAARDLLATDSTSIDLLITDQTMPELSGVDLAHVAQSLRPHLPVLLYSGHADLIDVEALKQTGIRRVLRKPLEPAELRAAIEDCLGTDS